MAGRKTIIVPKEFQKLAEQAKKPLSGDKKALLEAKTATEVVKGVAEDLARQFVNEVCGWACVQFIKLLPAAQAKWVTQPSMASKLGSYLNTEGWDVKMFAEERTAVILHKGKVKARFKAALVDPTEGEKENAKAP